MVGLVNATGVRVGDTLYVDPPVAFPGIPSFAPELFASIRAQRHRPVQAVPLAASASSTRRAWCRCCATPTSATRPRCSAAVGQMQFEVAVHRLENEFGAPVELTPTSYKVARRHRRGVGAGAAGACRACGCSQRADGALLALFESPYWLARVEADQPELRLDRLVAEGLAG